MTHMDNTRNGYLPRLPKPKTEWGKRTTYYKCTNDWASLPGDLRKPMPFNIFKKNLKRFLIYQYLERMELVLLFHFIFIILLLVFVFIFIFIYIFRVYNEFYC